MIFVLTSLVGAFSVIREGLLRALVTTKNTARCQIVRSPSSMISIHHIWEQSVNIQTLIINSKIAKTLASVNRWDDTFLNNVLTISSKNGPLPPTPSHNLDGLFFYSTVFDKRIYIDPCQCLNAQYKRPPLKLKTHAAHGPVSYVVTWKRWPQCYHGPGPHNLLPSKSWDSGAVDTRRTRAAWVDILLFTKNYCFGPFFIIFLPTFPISKQIHFAVILGFNCWKNEEM